MKKVVCKMCGTIFHTRYINREVMYCSRKCSYRDLSRMPRGKEHYRWKGGETIIGGRLCLSVLDPLTGKKKHKQKYIVNIEQILGLRLPAKTEIHHINGNPLDDRNTNLVICQNNAYHSLLHYKTRILKAGGNPATDKICSRCQQVKSKKEFPLGSAKHGDGYYAYCKPCKINYQKSYSV